jgi:hypothetical protein
MAGLINLKIHPADGRTCSGPKPWIHLDHHRYLHQVMREIIEKEEGHPISFTDLMAKILQRNEWFVHDHPELFLNITHSTQVEFWITDNLIQFDHFGRQAFALGPSMRERFEQTSLEGIPAFLMNLPYVSFWVSLMSCPIRFWAVDEWLILEGFYVTQLDDDRWRVSMIGRIPNSADVGLMTFFVDLPAFGRLKDFEQSLLDKNMPFIELPDESIREKTSDTIRQVLRILVNMILYLQSEAVEVRVHPDCAENQDRRKQLEGEIGRAKSRGKKQDKQRRLENISTVTVTWLGYTLEEAVESKHTGRHPRRHWVRGHWRLQHRKHGPIVPIWILPFQRGGREEVGETEGRIYQFKNEEAHP